MARLVDLLMKESPRAQPKQKSRSPAMTDALREAWAAHDKKDLDGFATAFENAVKITIAEMEEAT